MSRISTYFAILPPAPPPCTNACEREGKSDGDECRKGSSEDVPKEGHESREKEIEAYEEEEGEREDPGIYSLSLSLP